MATNFANGVYASTEKHTLAKQAEMLKITGDENTVGEDMSDPLVMLRLEKASMGMTTALSAGGGLLKSMKDAAEQLANKI